MTAAELIALAERVEATTADEQHAVMMAVIEIVYGRDTPAWRKAFLMVTVEAYESAAMPLVPEGWVIASMDWWPVTKRAGVTLRQVDDNGWGVGYGPESGDARSQSCAPALALAAAALRALAATKENRDG